jgi:putative membrane protein
MSQGCPTLAFTRTVVGRSVTSRFGPHRRMWMLWLPSLVLGLALAWMSSACTVPPPDSSSDPPRQGESLDTPYGPLSAADRELVVQVRLAGLWQVPGCRQAGTRGNNDVKQVASRMLAERVEFDARIRKVAAELSVPLPNQPNAEQIGSLAVLSNASPADYDRTFVRLLRDTQDDDLQIIARLSADSRNSLVRSLADEARVIATRHLGYLDGTGLVQNGSPSQAATTSKPATTPAPSASATVAGRPLIDGLYRDPLADVYSAAVWMVLGIAALAGLVTMVHLLRPR